MKFKRLNEEKGLTSYFDYIVSELGEKKAFAEIKKNMPFLLKVAITATPVVCSFFFGKKEGSILDALRDCIDKIDNAQEFKLWNEILITTAKKNGLNSLPRLGANLRESSFESEEIEKMWDFLVDRVDQKQLVRVLISGLELKMPEMASFLEEVYNRASPKEFLGLIREVISEQPDEMAFTVCWIAKKFKLEQEAKEFALEQGI